MPYTGDKPSNPVALTLTAGEATGTASDGSTTDRHICWFSIPAQSAGYSVELSTFEGAGSTLEVDICMVWAGGNTAYFANSYSNGFRQGSVYLPLPAGISVLVGVLPKGIQHPLDSSFTGESAAGAAKTALEWDAEFPADLTRRLPADITLQVSVGVTVVEPGSAADPVPLDFTLSQAAQTVDMTGWKLQGINLTARVPAGYAVKFSDESGQSFSLLSCTEPVCKGTTANEVAYKLAAATWTDVASAPSRPLPTVTLTAVAVVVSDISGTAIDTDGASLEPANLLMFKTQDAMYAARAPAGTYTVTNVIAGDYILAAFSQLDGRDVDATNVLVPQSERAIGGGYPFVDAPPET
jgi:hypothetical protein